MAAMIAPTSAAPAPLRPASIDIRKLLTDVFAETERQWRARHLRVPPQFPDMLQADALVRFTRATMGYALAFVKTKTMAKMPMDAAMQPQQDHAIQQKDACAREFAETYARLVLHCSNFERNKDDERFFECVYYLVSAVVKVGIAPEHWHAVERELAFLFRGAHYSAAATAATAAHAATDEGFSTTSESKTTTTAMLQGLATSRDGGSASRDLGAEDTPFVLRPAHYCHFSEADPVVKIVAEMETTKDRATRNIAISQALRDRLRTRRGDDAQQQLQSATKSSSRGSEHGGSLTTSNAMLAAADTRTTLHARSPVLRQLLPSTEDRVQGALREYEREWRGRAGKKMDAVEQAAPTSPSSSTNNKRVTPRFR